MTTKKALKKTIVLPPGRASYPFLAKPDTGREYSDDAWKFDHLVPLSVWNSVKKTGENAGKTYKQIVEEAILAVGRDHAGNPNLTFAEIKKQPIKYLADDAKTPPNMKDYVMMRVKNKNAQPLIVGLEKDSNGQPKELTAKQIESIKGGDWVEPVVDVFPYSQSGGGVTMGLNIVRFLKPGEPFGNNAAKHLGLLDDIEVTEEGFSDDALEALAKSSA